MLYWAKNLIKKHEQETATQSLDKYLTCQIIMTNKAAPCSVFILLNKHELIYVQLKSKPITRLIKGDKRWQNYCFFIFLQLDIFI